jgi:hypothetical protein
MALFVVVLLLAVVSGAVAVSLDESVDNIRSASMARNRELTRAGLEHGLHLGISQVRQMDPAALMSDVEQFDIFAEGDSIPVAAGRDFIGPLEYPPAGPYQGDYVVRVGLRPVQRTRAPAGEDVRHAHGQVLELQIGVETVRPGMPPAEDRVSVGVLLPRRSSHAN